MSHEFALAAMLSVMVSIILSNHLFGHSSSIASFRTEASTWRWAVAISK